MTPVAHAAGRESVVDPCDDVDRFVDADGLRWHVRQMGAGPVVLLIHGTGASTHSWRAVMPLLARRCRVVAMDLPGHAQTGALPPSRMSLPGIASAVAALVRRLDLQVDWLVGHSAGAAIAARLALDAAMSPHGLVAINGAFLPLAGLPGLLFPPVARLMAGTSLAPQLFARRRWDRPALERLIAGTGSTLDAQGLEHYGALVRDPRHAEGALRMMANWDLRPLTRDLAHLRTPLSLIVGDNDRAVPPADAQRVRALLRPATPCTVSIVHGAGHLAHEERPGEVAALVLRAMDQGMPA